MIEKDINTFLIYYLLLTRYLGFINIGLMAGKHSSYHIVQWLWFDDDKHNSQL